MTSLRIHTPASRRRLLTAAIAGLATQVIGSPAAFAQTYPTKNIVLVVPTATGGANDAMARIIAQGLTQKLGKPVVVENKAGAQGSIASEAVARAAPDGHTILFGYIATHGINPVLQKLRYDPVADFEPIGKVAVSPTLMVASTSVPANSAKELVALIKAKPGSISYASAGAGTVPHIAGEMFKLSTGVDIVHVPYKGSAPAMVDTIGGTTQLMFPSVFTAYPYVKNGKLKALGLAGDKRSPIMKDVPTLAEQGISNVDISQWYAMFAPAKTPKAIVDRLNHDLNAVLNDPTVIKRLREQGAEVDTGTPEQLKTLVVQDLARWKSVVSAAKITAE